MKGFAVTCLWFAVALIALLPVGFAANATELKAAETNKLPPVVTTEMLNSRTWRFIEAELDNVYEVHAVAAIRDGCLLEAISLLAESDCAETGPSRGELRNRAARRMEEGIAQLTKAAESLNADERHEANLAIAELSWRIGGMDDVVLRICKDLAPRLDGGSRGLALHLLARVRAPDAIRDLHGYVQERANGEITLRFGNAWRDAIGSYRVAQWSDDSAVMAPSSKADQDQKVAQRDAPISRASELLRRYPASPLVAKNARFHELISSSKVAPAERSAARVWVGGVVQDADGKALEQVLTLSFQAADPKPIANITDEHGVLSEMQLKPGRYTVKVYDRTARLLLVRDVDVPKNEDVVKLQLAIASGSIVGRVLDEKGEPVAGQTVMAASQQVGAAYSVTTDAEGKYRIAVVVPGEYDVIAMELKTYKRGASKVSVSESEVRSDIRLAAKQ